MSGIFGSGGPRVGASGEKKGVSFQDEMEEEASHQQDPAPTKPSRKGRFYDGQVLQHINCKGVKSIVTVVEVHDDEDFPHHTLCCLTMLMGSKSSKRVYLRFNTILTNLRMGVGMNM